MGITLHLTCLLRNLYAGQEATVRNWHGTMDWFQIGKGVCQGFILSPCLFNLYVEWLYGKCWNGWSTSWNQDCWVKWNEMKSLSHVRLFVTPWTVAYQAPPSMGFSRQECWSGLPFPSPGDLPDPGIEPGSPASPALQADSFPLSHWGFSFKKSHGHLAFSSRAFLPQGRLLSFF